MGKGKNNVWIHKPFAQCTMHILLLWYSSHLDCIYVLVSVIIRVQCAPSNKVNLHKETFEISARQQQQQVKEKLSIEFRV